MIKIRNILGLTIITGTDFEIERVEALSGTELPEGDKLTVLPLGSHIQRNPRKPIIRYIEDKEAENELNRKT